MQPSLSSTHTHTLFLMKYMLQMISVILPEEDSRIIFWLLATVQFFYMVLNIIILWRSHAGETVWCLSFLQVSEWTCSNLPGSSVVSEIEEHGREPVVNLVQSALFVWRLQDGLLDNTQRQVLNNFTNKSTASVSVFPQKLTHLIR